MPAIAQPTAHANPIGLRLIGGFKFVSGLLLVALAVGLYRHRGDNFADALIHLAEALKIDPGNHYIHSLQEMLTGVTQRQVAGVIIGTFLYASLYLTEGIGLLLRKHWAEYFTIFATGLFIPLEIYEIYRHPTGIKVVVFVLNAAIVAYLVSQLYRNREAPRPATKSAA